MGCDIILRRTRIIVFYIEGNINSDYYCKILDEVLPDFDGLALKISKFWNGPLAPLTLIQFKIFGPLSKIKYGREFLN